MYTSPKGIKLIAEETSFYKGLKKSIICVVGPYSIDTLFDKLPTKLRFYKYPCYSHFCEIEATDGHVWVRPYTMFGKHHEEIINIVTNKLDLIYKEITSSGNQGKSVLFDADRQCFVRNIDFEEREAIDLAEVPSYIPFIVHPIVGYASDPSAVYFFDCNTNNRPNGDACILSFMNNLTRFAPLPDSKTYVGEFAPVMLALLSGMMNGINQLVLTDELTNSTGDSVRYVNFRIKGMNFQENIDVIKKVDAYNADYLIRAMGLEFDDNYYIPKQKGEVHRISDIIGVGLDKYIKDCAKLGINDFDVEIDINSTGITKMYVKNGAGFISPSDSHFIDVGEYEDMLNSSNVFLLN